MKRERSLLLASVLAPLALVVLLAGCSGKSGGNGNFCQGASVPSSNAALYDNAGLPPFPAPAAPVCP